MQDPRKEDVDRLAEVARHFVSLYELNENPARAHGMSKARMLAAMGTLIGAAARMHFIVSRETSEENDGTTGQPPF